MRQKPVITKIAIFSSTCLRIRYSVAWHLVSGHLIVLCPQASRTLFTPPDARPQIDGQTDVRAVTQIARPPTEIDCNRAAVKALAVGRLLMLRGCNLAPIPRAA